MALQLLSVIPLIFFLVISFMLTPTDNIITLIPAPLASEALHLKETIPTLLNTFPAEIKPILLSISALMSSVVSFIFITALCSFFKEDLKPS
jgi:hypothetical protein